MRKVYLKGLLLVLTLFCSTSSWAYDFKVDTENEDGTTTTVYYTITSEDGAEQLTVEVANATSDGTVVYESYSGDVVIPRTVTYENKEYTVTGVGSYAFSEQASSASTAAHNLKSVTLPETITSIGDYAFYYCEHLTSINIPNGVTSIGNYAFCYCCGITSIDIPESVTSIGDYAFYFCDVLTSINIPNGVTSIGNYAFCDCWSLTSIDIPDGVTSIGNYAFYLCFSLETVTLPASLTTIEDYTFWECTGLTSIVIPDNVTSIGEYAFSQCTSLETVTLPASLATIEDYTFWFCKSLTSIVIPDNVTSIGEYAFSGCTSLETVTLPASLASMGMYAFEICSALKTIYSHIMNPEKINPTAFIGSDVDLGECTLYVPEDCESAYEGTYWETNFGFTISSDIAIIPWITVNAEDDNAEESEDGAWYSTYYNSKYSYYMPDGVTGYTVTVDDGNLAMNEAYKSGDVVPAGTALLLKSDTEIEYVFQHLVTDEEEVSSEEEGETADNMLYGSDEEGTTTGPEEGGSYVFYKLSYNTDGEALGFYWGAADGAAFTSAAHKAWLTVPEDSNVKLSSFSFSGSTQTTDITPALAEAGTRADAPVYDLSGRRVSNPQKGIYIQNGKKYIRK